MFFAVWAACVASSAAQPFEPAQPGKLQSDPSANALALRIELSADGRTKDIDLEQPFHVVLKNNSNEVLRIWNPRLRQGYRQLSFRFRDPHSEKSLVVAKRDISDDEYWNSTMKQVVPPSSSIEIAPGDTHFIRVRFADYANENDVWENLPDLNSSTQFEVTAILESSESDGTDSSGVWHGTIQSDPISARYIAPDLKTAHDYLVAGYTKQAIQLASQDRRALRRRVDEMTLLHVAAQRNNVEALTWLLEHGADVDAKTYNDSTALHLTDDPKIVELLLTKHADVSPRNSDSADNLRSAYHDAIEEFTDARDEPERTKWRKIIDLYLTTGAEYDLFAAIHLDDLAGVKQILEADPQQAKKRLFRSPLRMAARLGRVDICKLLIEQYDVDVDDFEGGSGFPIITEAVQFPEIVRLLIANGADLKTRITWRGGWGGGKAIGDNATALHFAAYANNAETVTLLIDNGVGIFAETQDITPNLSKQMALDVAASCGSAASAEAMINHPKFDEADEGVRKKLLDESLWKFASTIWVTDKAERPRLIEVLIAKGANPNVTLYGRTALQNAVARIYPSDKPDSREGRQGVDVLKHHGVKVDFHSAVKLGDEEAVAAALAANAAVANDLGPEGRPALHVAVDFDHRGIVALLIKAGCDLEIRNKSKSTGSPDATALHAAAFWRREEIARMLIEAGADVNAKSADGATPLHESARVTTIAVAKLLLAAGADVNAKDNEGNTPLDQLREEDDENAAEMEKLLAKYHAKSAQ